MGRKRLGILTAGGDCAGLNAVISGVVRTAAIHDLEVIGFAEGYEGLLHPSTARLLSQEETRGIELTGGTILGSTNKGKFQSRRGADGTLALPESLIRAARHSLDHHRVDGLIVLGGDGSLRTALQLSKSGINIIGVPKTIDNDIDATDVAFGFDTAVSRVAEAVTNLRSTAESHRRILILEVMGRHTGWLALHGAIAGGADIALIPEVPLDSERLTQFIKKSEREGHRSLVMVIAEGTRAKSGNQIRQKTSAGDSRLGGVGHHLESLVARCTGRETRCTVLGHLQRGGTPGAFDRILGQQFGVHAVALAADGKYGRMVSYRSGEVTEVALADAVNHRRNITPQSQILGHARALGIFLGN